MNIVAFVGPSLAAEDLAEFADIEFRPPAGEGDLLRAASEDPFAIGLVDGVFGSRATVRHQEILWALSRGIHVVGGASMGALRAADLHTLGMIGVGWIFEAYRDGRVVAEDEVAVIHAPAECGSLQLSEPLIDIRYALERALLEGVVTEPIATRLLELGRHRFFPDRSWPQLYRDARAAGIAASSLAGLERWRSERRPRRKRQDALEVLRRLGELRAAARAPGPTGFMLRRTPFLDKQLRRVSSGLRDSDPLL